MLLQLFIEIVATVRAYVPLIKYFKWKTKTTAKQMTNDDMNFWG